MSVRRISAAFQASVRPADEHWFKAAIDDDLETVVLLLSSRVDPNGVDKAGNTALHLAAYKGAVEVVSLLMKTSADVNKRNKESLTPFLLAASAGHDFVVKLFLQDARVDKFALDQEGATALHLAATAYNAATVKMLIRSSISPDLRDEHGFTPVMYAARAGQILTVAALLDGGSDPLVRSLSGLSAVDLADRFGHNSVVTFIKNFLTKLVVSEEEEVEAEAPIPFGQDEIAQEPHLVHLLGLLREFHVSAENRSPEFADQVKSRLDEAFEELATDGKISRSTLLNKLPESATLVHAESVDKRIFAVVLTALAIVPDN